MMPSSSHRHQPNPRGCRRLTPLLLLTLLSSPSPSLSLTPPGSRLSLLSSRLTLFSTKPLFWRRRTVAATAADAAAAAAAESGSASPTLTPRPPFEGLPTADAPPDWRLRLLLSAPLVGCLALLACVEGLASRLGVSVHLSRILTLFSAVAKLLTARNRGLFLVTVLPALPFLIHRAFVSAHSVKEAARRVRQRGRYKPTAFIDSIIAAPVLPAELLTVFSVGLHAYELLTPARQLKRMKTQIHIARTLSFQLAGAWAVLRIIAAAEARSEAKGDEESAFSGYKSQDESIRHARVNTLSRAASILVTAGTAMLALSTLGVDVRALLAVSGAGGLVLGLAGREVLANYIGGVIIYLSQPFSVGDWIHNQEGTIDGIVERIGWYYTKVNTWDRRPIYIPNAKFYTMAILNASRMSHRRILHTVRLRLTDIKKLPNIVREIRQMVVTHAKVDRRQHRLVYFRAIGDFSLDIYLSCYVKSSDFYPTQQDILLSISHIVDANGASFANSLERKPIDGEGESEPLLEPPHDPASPPAGMQPPMRAGETTYVSAAERKVEAAISTGTPPPPASAAPEGPPKGFKNADELL